MLRLAVIADDLTGANDTAVQFAKRGINSYVWLNSNDQDLLPPKAEVLVLDTDSRDVSPSSAYAIVEKASRALYSAGVRTVYKKIDSTLRGNLGAEIEAAAAVFEPEVIVIAPAFPSNNRVTVGGYHLLNQLPIALTEIARDPKTPVNESRVPELLRQQTECKIGYIPLDVVMAGIPAIQKAVAERLVQGEKWLVFDAAVDEHLRLIAQVGREYRNVLWVGSAGLAEVLPEFYEWSTGDKYVPTAALGPVLLVAGSVSEITRGQMVSFLKTPGARLVQMNVAGLFRDKDAEIKRCIQAARALLMAGSDVLVTSAVDKTDVDNAVAAGEGCGLSKAEVSCQTAAALGAVAAALAELELAGMILTGGDTAACVCEKLGAEAIEVVAEVAVGIPLGLLVGGRCDGLKVVTKAGAFGEEAAFSCARDALKGGEIYGGNTRKL
ncbi:MAG: type effector Hrp-dependent outer protein [Firmicutes bacterium]|nr:type effector Hrp-dependent outer protein [Bacillota bacterium]